MEPDFNNRSHFLMPIFVLLHYTPAAVNMLAQVWLGPFYPFSGFFQQRTAVHMGKKLRNRKDMRPLILMRNPVSQTFSFGKLFMNLTNVIMLMLSGGLSSYRYKGSSIKKFNRSSDFPWLEESSVQAIDIERFRWFSRGYIAKDPRFSNRVAGYTLLFSAE